MASRRRRTAAGGLRSMRARADSALSPGRAGLMEEKARATAAGQPWVAVIDAGMESGRGRVEIDYNADFIRVIREGSGDHSKSEEEIVDQWFKGVCLRERMEESVIRGSLKSPHRKS